MATTYTVDKGKHYCNGIHFGTTSSDQKFRFMFHADCIYDEATVIPGWNKLYGWSGSQNHQNSVRIGWRCITGKIIVGYYCYVNGTLVDGELCEVLPGQWYEGECKVDNGNFVVRVNTFSQTVPGGKKPLIAFINRFYFGGESVAPHTMSAEIEKL